MNDNQLFFFNDFINIYWHGIIIALAVFVGYAAFFLFARHINGKAASAVRLTVIISFPFALILSRLQYCLLRPDEFDGFLDILQIHKGGMGLYGAIAGAALAVAVGWIFNKTMPLSELFDAAAIAGCLAVAIGRTAAHFSGEETGIAVTNTFFQKVMFTEYSPTENSPIVSVYAYEALAALAIFVILFFDFRAVYVSGRLARGSVALRFLLLYSAAQIIFESWRTDALFIDMRSGIRFSQVVSAAILTALLVLFCVCYCLRHGFDKKQLCLWGGIFMLIALIFVCEFTMTNSVNIRNYCGMGLGLIGAAVIGWRLLDMTQNTHSGAASAEETSAAEE